MILHMRQFKSNFRIYEYIECDPANKNGEARYGADNGIHAVWNRPQSLAGLLESQVRRDGSPAKRGGS
jgi:hypothetical protein